jgi:hypothetical protein
MTDRRKPNWRARFYKWGKLNASVDIFANNSEEALRVCKKILWLPDEDDEIMVRPIKEVMFNNQRYLKEVEYNEEDTEESFDGWLG